MESDTPQLSPVVSFYLGKSSTPPPDRYTIETLRECAEDWEFLEDEHAYIQWMFPLEVKSGIVARAPIVTPEDTALFASDEGLQHIVLEMLDIMLYFYGLKRSKEIIKVKNERLFRYSLRPYNHNLLRISRILRSLRLLGRGKESIALFEVLETSLAEVAGLKRTFTFWHKAVYGPFDFPGTAEGPAGTASQPAAGPSGSAAGPNASKAGLASWGIKPFFTSKRKAQPDNLQVIRSSIMRGPEHAPGLEQAQNAPLLSHTDPHASSDTDVNALRKDEGGSAQTSDPRAQQSPVAPSSNASHLPNSSSSSNPNGSEQAAIPRLDRDEALAGLGLPPGEPACAIPHDVNGTGQRDVSGGGSAVLGTSQTNQDPSVPSSSQINDRQPFAESVSDPVRSNAAAASLKNDGTDVSNPECHRASPGLLFAQDAAPAVSAQGVRSREASDSNT
ncbi:hypothetical protein WJX74_007414 [Apatococcus lobatus]|uniref:Opioid growth factor receptor (OGFr) conserved domain-containing protein n=1 Tax=Apatococcus lobatus TaxID=904363 RepID=A0AAW1QK65_9CHLO